MLWAMLLMLVGGFGMVCILIGFFVELCEDKPISKDMTRTMVSAFIASFLVFCGGNYLNGLAASAKPAPPKRLYDVECFSGGVRVFSRNGVEHQSYGQMVGIDANSSTEVLVYGGTCVAHLVKPLE